MKTRPAITQPGLTGYVLIASAIAAIGGILFGFDTGIISGAILFIYKQWHLTHAQAELATSSVLIGAVLGAIAGGALGDRLGRKKSIIYATLLFLAGTVIVSVSPSMDPFLIGRVLIGAAIGVASFMVPLYISEIAPPAIRGAMVSLNQFAVTLGILVSYGVNYAFARAENWHAMFAVGLLPGVILLVGMFFLPESPRWLLSVHRKDEASKVLTKVRAENDVSAEVAEIEHEISAETGGSFSELLAPELRLPLIIGLGLAILQQVTGVNTVIYYAPAIFKTAGLGSASASIAATAGIGIVNVVMTAVAIWLLDRAGRRPLLLWSAGGMTLALAMLGLGFFLHGDQASAGGGLAVFTGISLVVYIASFAIGMGPVFWLLIAELYPIKTRALAMSVATVANWAANYVVAATFLSIAGVVGNGGVFWLYGATGLLTWFFVLRLVPETKGKTLREIQEVLALRRASPAATGCVSARQSDSERDTDHGEPQAGHRTAAPR